MSPDRRLKCLLLLAELCGFYNKLEENGSNLNAR